VELASGLVIGIAAIIVAAAMVWFGMPNRAGESPPFLRNSLLQMLYPAIVVAVVAFAIAELLVSSR
jgi:hypothetical protein